MELLQGLPEALQMDLHQEARRGKLANVMALSGVGWRGRRAHVYICHRCNCRGAVRGPRPSLAHAASFILERSGRISRDRRGIVQIQILSCLLSRQRKRRPGVFLAFGWATISGRESMLGVFCWGKRAAAFPRISLFHS